MSKYYMQKCLSIKADIFGRSDTEITYSYSMPVVAHRCLSLSRWGECRKTQRPHEPMDLGTEAGGGESCQQQRLGRKETSAW